MSDYISKPIYIEEVQNKLKYWGSKIHSEQSSPLIEQTQIPPQEGVTVRENLPVLDLEVLLERVDHDTEITLELLDLFLMEAESIMAFMETEALQAGSPESIAYQAHKLKGLTRDIGGEQLGNLALQLELQAKEGSITDPALTSAEIAQAYTALKKEIALWQVEHTI